jgi:hypothetical protein
MKTTDIEQDCIYCDGNCVLTGLFGPVGIYTDFYFECKECGKKFTIRDNRKKED